ncbi:MAG: gliding motility-associated ABC transporter ATP-binding subunit GldA [Bacteroidales bacterium]|nr:gliding motility-associated ABC transporter ATP-binding subunit GldA [Bacteroidales bacterium]
MSITVNTVTKLYGPQKALDNVSFSVNTGEIVGFLGPNGAGKSTMMRIITGYIAPDHGHALVNNINVAEQPIDVRKQIGYLPENNPLYPEMYVKEYLGYIAGLYKLGKQTNKRINDIINQTGLGPEQHKHIGALSKGYRQRVGLAQALIHDPGVLILDEPTSGLDPNQIVEIRNLISRAGKEKTVMLSTHIMQEVEAVCDRIIIIDKGSIRADEDKESIFSRATKETATVLVEFDIRVDELMLQNVEGIIGIRHLDGNTLLLETPAYEDIRPKIFRFAVDNGFTVLSMQIKEQSLEEVFRDLTS